MKSKYKIVLYYHNTAHVDLYEKYLREARKDLQLFVCRSIKEVEGVIDQADILFTGHMFPIELFDKAKNLKWMHSLAAGVERYARGNQFPPNILLTKTKGTYGAIMAEYVVGYILAITQDMRKMFKNKERKRWEPFTVDSIRKKVVGVMGLGSVGAAIAHRVHLMGAEVIGLEEQEKSLPYITLEYSVEETEEFLNRSDFVVIAIPLTDYTEGIFGEKEFSMMKRGAYLMNVSRGPLVQEKALLKALKEGPIAGAVLDVFQQEPLPENHPLWNMDNVILTPHISGPAIPKAIAQVFLRNLRKFEEGKKLEGVVDRQKQY
jgi:phosphoglycerate dehydrogenase-like enzyme